MPIDPRTQRARAAIRRARLYARCNRLIRLLPHVFWVSVLLFFMELFVVADRSEYFGAVLAMPTAAVILLSGLAYPISLLLREMLDRGQRPWRFSLRYLLGVMTCVAIVMGTLIVTLKHLK
jgi:hypothetical protein